jgi:uncharacterized DUF497 family protein
MKDDGFEWDDAKARRNYSRHGVTLEFARKAFADPFMVEVLDTGRTMGRIVILSSGGPRASCSASSTWSASGAFV